MSAARETASTFQHWEHLPDPREGCRAGASCRVSIALADPREGWLHFAEGHVRESAEPWDDVFPPKILAALKEYGRSRQCPSEEMWQRASGALERHLREALEFPLAMTYFDTRFYVPRRKPRQRWLLVLPNAGAVMALSSTAEGGRVISCYFLDRYRRKYTPQRRAELVVYHLRRKHAEWDPQTGKYVPPHPNYRVPVTPKPESSDEGLTGVPDRDLSRIQFVTLESWFLPGPEHDRLPLGKKRQWMGKRRSL